MQDQQENQQINLQELQTIYNLEQNSIFLNKFKEITEKIWENKELNPSIYGFQIQKNTKWNQGLSAQQIQEFETELGVQFPEIYKDYLRILNGTNLPGINIFGNSGEEPTYHPKYYQYPNDIQAMKDKMQWIYDSFEIKKEDVDGENIPFIIPLMGHRFLIADKEGLNPVFSMYGDDVIIYNVDLKEFLIEDIFGVKTSTEQQQKDTYSKCKNCFWLQHG